MLITNQPDVAAFAESAGVDVAFVDLEVRGKAQRQAGFDTVQSAHRLDDVPRVKAALRSARLLVRVNPMHVGTAAEVEGALAGGADVLMLPMFTSAHEVRAFVAMVGGRAQTCLLLETPPALARCEPILAIPGVDMVHVGLNDLNLSLGTRFLFESLAGGAVEMVARAARRNGVSFGFGGVARLGAGELPAGLVVAEHARLGSERVILSRAFHGRASGLRELQANVDLPAEVARLRAAYQAAVRRPPDQEEADRRRLVAAVGRIAGESAESAEGA